MAGGDDVKIGLFTIWAIGVGSALGGDFFGWQFILYGGFASAFLGVLFAGAFYWIYAAAITELAARYKTSGGSFDFVRAALGEKSAAVMAILGLLKLLLANAALALSISSYLSEAGMSPKLQPLCWIGTYGIFTVLDSVGVKQSAVAQFLATALCVCILLFYSFSASTKFKVNNIYSGGYCHGGLNGFFKGLPFALQFFDGFEEVPLLMGYAIDPERTIPDAIRACYVTVSIIAVLILIFGSGATPAIELLASEAPLMNGIEEVYGIGSVVSNVIDYLIVVGLVVNFFAFVLFSSQQVQAVAEAGQLPSFLSYRHPTHGAPIYASIFSSCIGILLSAGFSYVFGEAGAQNTLVTAALMPAVLGYMLLLQCIVRIRNIEDEVASNPSKPLSIRDKQRLAAEPKNLRFTYGKSGAQIAQLMCLCFVVGLFVLAAVNIEFFYGLVVLLLLALMSFAGMYQFILFKESQELIEYQKLADDDSLLKDGSEHNNNSSNFTSSGFFNSNSNSNSNNDQSSNSHTSTTSHNINNYTGSDSNNIIISNSSGKSNSKSNSKNNSNTISNKYFVKIENQMLEMGQQHQQRPTSSN